MTPPSRRGPVGAPARARPPDGVPRWLPGSAVAITAGGLAASGYLTYEHFTAATALACPNQGGLDCETVTSSAQSMLFGVPVAVLGLAYFAAMLVIVSPAAWRVPQPRLRQALHAARLGGSGAGICYVLYLVYAELFIIGSICLWCTVVHLLSFALFGVIAFGTAVLPPAPAGRVPAGATMPRAGRTAVPGRGPATGRKPAGSPRGERPAAQRTGEDAADVPGTD